MVTSISLHPVMRATGATKPFRRTIGATCDGSLPDDAHRYPIMRLRWIDDAGETHACDLFGLFALLASDKIQQLATLRPHQRQHVHAFACQVAALALLEAGQTDLPTSPRRWRELLLALTPDQPDGSAWDLVVDDWDAPALLQAPGLDTALRNAPKKLVRTPDELDVLRGARNHDLKLGAMRDVGDDDWLYALITLQTGDGLEGRGLYGIVRMNSGYGSRIAVSLQPADLRPGSAFARDVGVLVRAHAAALEAGPMTGSLRLSWLEPWDGTSQLSLSDLDPYAVEICRRGRLLRTASGSLGASLSGSTVPRIDPAGSRGVTGDPWAPVLADGSKSVTIEGSGFGYARLARLLDPERVRLPLLAYRQAHERDAPMMLRACGIVRGQGKTEGFHERIVALPERVLGGDSDERARLGTTLEARLLEASAARSILRHAATMLHSGGPSPEALRFDDAAVQQRVARVTGLVDHRVDLIFFDALWAELADAEPPTARSTHGASWRRRLAELASEAFDAQTDTTGASALCRLRSIARASVILDGRLARFVRVGVEPADAAAAPDETSA